MNRSSGCSGVHHPLCVGLHHPFPVSSPTDSSAPRNHRKDAPTQHGASSVPGCTGPAQTQPRQQRILYLTSLSRAWPLIEQPVASVHANNPTALYYLHSKLSSQSEANNDLTETFCLFAYFLRRESSLRESKHAPASWMMTSVYCYFTGIIIGYTCTAHTLSKQTAQQED